MAEAYSAGSIFVDVIPSYRKLVDNLRRDADSIQKEIGEAAFGEGVDREAKSAGTRSGKTYAGAFEQELKRNIGPALKALGDGSGAEIQRIRGQLEKLRDARIGVHLDVAEFRTVSREILAEVDRLGSRSPNIQVKTDTAAASVALRKLLQDVNRLDGQTVDVQVDADTAKATGKLNMLSAVINKISKNRVNIQTDADTAGATAKLGAVYRLTRMISGMRAKINVNVDTGAAMAKLAALRLMMKGTGGDAQDGANAFRGFSGVILGAALVGPILIPILAAIAGGLVLITTAATGVVAGLGVMILGFSGIGDAVKALGEVEKNAAKDTEAAAKTMRDAYRAVADARRNLTDARKNAAQADADAERGLAEAIENGREAEVEASRNMTRARQDAAQAGIDAERGLAEAIENGREAEVEATRNLTRSRQDAAQAGIDAERGLAEARERGREAEVEATRNLTEARQNGAQAGIEAERALVEAVQRGSEAQAEARRNLTEVRKSAAQADADAERGLAEAIENGREAEADASRNLTRTVKDGRAAQAEAARDLARTVEDAAEAQQDAERALQETRRESAQEAADSARAVAEARRQAADQIEQALQQEVKAQNSVEDAVQQVADAEQALRDARESARQEEADLADQIKANNLNEAQGVIDLFNATVEYNALLEDGAATNLDKEQGRINLERAKLSLKQVRDLERELNAESEKAGKPGVANNEGVLAAQDNLTEAIEAQREAVIALGEASKGVDDARAEGARDIRDALRAQSRSAKENAEAIADAQRTVRRAYEDGAEAIADAQRTVREVAERIAEAIADAQLGVRKAHEDSAEGINAAQRNVASTAKDGAEAVKGAQRDVRKAHEDSAEGINAAQRNVASTAKESAQSIKDAQQGVRQAHEDSAEGIKAAQRNVTRTTKDGARSITDAQRSVRQAHEDSAEGIKAAQRNVTRTTKDGARSITDAQRSVRQAHEDSAEGIKAAQRNVTRTARDGAKSVQGAQRGVRRAQQGVRDALVETGKTGSESMQKLEEAMGKLSPAGRRFARFLFSLRDEFRQLRDAAQQGMLPGVQRSIEMLMDKYFPSFVKFVRRMARTVGGLFEDMGRRMTKDSAFTGFFAMVNDLGPRFMRQFGRMMLNWLGVFLRLLTITAPFAKTFSDAMLDLSKRALDWSKSTEGTEIWQKFMAYVMEVGPRVWEFFKSLIGAFLNIAEGLAPFAGFLLDILTSILDFIAEMDPKLLGNIAFAILGIVIAIQLAFAAVSALTIVTTVWASSLGVMVAGVVLVAIALVLLYRNSETARRIMNAAWAAIKKGFDLLVDGMQWAWKNVLKPTFDAIGEFFVWLWEKAVKPYLGKVGDFWKTVSDAFGWTWENVLSPTFDAVGAAFKWLWEKASRPYLDNVRDFWKTVLGAMLWAWKNVLSPVFDAIGAAFKWLWVKVSKPNLGSIEDFWGTVLGAMVWAWKNVLSPTFDALGVAFKWLWEKVVKPLMGKIRDLWENVFDALEWSWDNVLSPTFDALGVTFKWLWEKVVKPLMGKVRDFWETVFDALEWSWDNVLSPVFDALGVIFKWLWEKVVKPLMGKIRDLWEAVFDALEWAWDKVLSPTFDALGATFKWLWEKVVKPLMEKIQKLWGNVFDAMEWAWDNVLKPVFGFIKKALVGENGDGGLVGVFKSGVRKIKELWTDLKGFLASPIEWVITNVLNRGIIGGFNKIAEFFSGKEQTIGYIGGSEKYEFASGGVTPWGVRPGYTPGRDTHLIAVGGGETIMRPEWTNFVGEETIDRWNAAARRGGASAVRRAMTSGYADGGVVPGYARGGIVSLDGEPLDLLTAAQIRLAESLAKTNIYVIQGSFQPVTPYSGTTHTGAGVVDVSPVNNTVVSALQLAAFAAWDRTNKGDWGPHIHAVSQIAVGVDSAASAQMQQFLAGTGDGLGNAAYGPRLKPIPNLELFLEKYLDDTFKGSFDVPGMSLPSLPSLPDWIAGAIKDPAGYLMGKVEGFFDNDLFDGSAGDTLKKIPEKLAGYAIDKIKAFAAAVKDSAEKIVNVAAATDDMTKATVAEAQSFARDRLGSYMWGPEQWEPLRNLWAAESGWDWDADNPNSSAYGIPQSLPGSKMATIGSDWRTNAGTQILWGLKYIKEVYGTPSMAWAHFQANNSYATGGVVDEDATGGRTMMYDNGGYLPPGLTTVLNLTGRPEPVLTSDQFDRLENGGMPGATFNNNFYGTEVTATDIADQMMFELRSADHAGRYRR